MASKKRSPVCGDEAPAVLSPKALAKRWGVTTRTLDRHRQAGLGPPFFYINGRSGKVAYRLAAVEEWERAQERRSTSDKLAA